MSTFNNRPGGPQAKQKEVPPVVNLLTRVIALIDDIIALMEEEVPMVEGRKRVEHVELLKRKQRLTLDYRSCLKAIIMEPDLLKQAPEDLRNKARLAADRLAEATNRNARVLRAIMTSSQRLVQSIVGMIKDEMLPQTGYKNIQSGNVAGSYSPTCKPVTVYRTA